VKVIVPSNTIRIGRQARLSAIEEKFVISHKFTTQAELGAYFKTLETYTL
jgi:sorbitol-specific phosphotransferase system component IIA